MKKAAIFDEYSYFEGMSKVEITKVMEDYHKFKISKNVYTGEKMEPEDSPGNFTVFEDERGVVFRTYSAGGFPGDVITNKPVDVKYEDERNEIEELYGQLVKESTGGKWYKSFGKILSYRPRNYEYHAILVKLFRKRPKELIPVVLNDVGLRLKQLPVHARKVEYELSMLGCISHIEPPMDVNDAKEVRKFLGKVEAWYAGGRN